MNTTFANDHRQALESKEALEVAKCKEASAEAKDREANAKLAGILAREQAVADHKQQHAAALEATQAADQVREFLLSLLLSLFVMLKGVCGEKTIRAQSSHVANHMKANPAGKVCIVSWVLQPCLFKCPYQRGKQPARHTKHVAVPRVLHMKPLLAH